jgi:hypothetical protein
LLVVFDHVDTQAVSFSTVVIWGF